MNTKLLILLVLGFVLTINTKSVSQSSYELSTNKHSKIGEPGKMEPYVLRPNSEKLNPRITNIPQLISNIKKHHVLNIDKSKSHPKFITPIRQKEGIDNPGFYSITAYFDHNDIYPNYLSDYNCEDLTYDLPTGYNHAGTDYFLWPFPWHKMSQDEVEIIAAAPGIIITKQDSLFDQSCGENSETWNGVGILHEDGSTSWYVHMKKYSLTDKPLYDQVEQGEFLGIVGSSGQSFAPHLHFEVYNSNDQLIDPFEGPCNNTITDNWWLNQEPYTQSALNKLATNNQLPEFPECPDEEIPNESNSFYPNDSIWLLSYYRNVFFGDTISVSVFRPGGLLYSTRVWLSPDNFHTTSWLWFPLILNENDPGGEWTYQINYKGVTYDHKFQYINPQGIESSLYQQQFLLYPNPALDNLTIDFFGAEVQFYSINIYNILGEMILQKDQLDGGESKFKLDVSQLKNGIYFLELNNSYGLQSVKFIKK